jgi:cysteine-rich repeat protein
MRISDGDHWLKKHTLMIGMLAAATACGGDSTTDLTGSGGSSSVTATTGVGATGGQGGSAAPRCGDGQVDPGEGCDDGNSNNSDACPDDAQNGGTCQSASCGDGFVQTGVEGCDDGNMIDSDECTNACALPACGDGIVQMGEGCDDGNMDNTDDCPDDAQNGGTCQAASCGDGFLFTGMETCDDGNMVDDDGCSNACEGWLKRQPITLTATNAQNDYIVLFALDMNNFNYAAAAADGADLRFGTDSDSLNGFELQHAIGSWDAAGTSYVFVRVPVLAAGANTIYVFYDFSGASVTTKSDFDAVFVNQVVSNGSAEISGDIVTHFYHVQAGDTLSVKAGAAVTITATLVFIQGTITADGRGNGSKSGPGAGTTSNNAGAAGGSYGAKGGKGGFDVGDSPGVGGPLSGTGTGDDIAMGSGGGGRNIPGGSGGGAITIDAEGIETLASSSITANGTAGGNAGKCSGGGSGGGVLLRGRHMVLGGAISASGGLGGQGTSFANDSGGGGGGRIKLFFGEVLSNTGTALAVGGQGGPNGTSAGSEAGGTKLFYSDNSTPNAKLELPAIALGTEEAN